MVRANKIPYNNFEYNIQRAKALARLDGYLKDIIYDGGKRTLGPFINIQSDITELVKMDEVFKELGTKIEERFKKYDKKELDKIGKKVTSQIKPHLKKIETILGDLGLVMNQTLPEQALILGVSAFEVYLHELTVIIISSDSDVRKRFHNEIEAGFSRTKLEQYREDYKRTQGEIVAELIKLDANKIKSLLKRLIGTENIFENSGFEKKFIKIIECRNVIIHQAGFVDPKFKKITKYAGPIDSPIKISRRYALQSINFLEKLVNRTESTIHSK